MSSNSLGSLPRHRVPESVMPTVKLILISVLALTSVMMSFNLWYQAPPNAPGNTETLQLAGYFRYVEDNKSTQFEILKARLNSLIQSRLKEGRSYRQRLERDFRFVKNRNTSVVLPFLVTIQPPDGGLGNFMFNFASLVGIARKNGRIPVLIGPEPRMAYFEGMSLELVDKNYIFPNGNLDYHRIGDHGAGKFAPEMHNLTAYFWNETAVLQGYLQSWKYFDHARAEIRAMFTFNEYTLVAARNKIIAGLKHAEKSLPSALSNEPLRLIGIHVRRGDILWDSNINHGHVPASEEYLLRTTLHLQIKNPSAVFIVLSNDISYCRDVFQLENFVFVEGSPPEVDMAIMSLMDIMVISVGSYGWWGSYLSDAKEIFYYKNWPQNGSQYQQLVNPEDYFLPNWQARA